MGENESQPRDAYQTGVRARFFCSGGEPAAVSDTEVDPRRSSGALACRRVVVLPAGLLIQPWVSTRTLAFWSRPNLLCLFYFLVIYLAGLILDGGGGKVGKAG